MLQIVVVFKVYEDIGGYSLGYQEVFLRLVHLLCIGAFLIPIESFYLVILGEDLRGLIHYAR